MQLDMPFFPSGTKLINSTVGFHEQDGTVFYFLNGKTIYCHSKDKRDCFRFALANLKANDLCSVGELSSAFGISRRNIERYVKSFREKGMTYFFVVKTNEVNVTR